MAQEKIKTLLPKKYNRFLGNKDADSSLKQNREELLEWMAAKEQGGYRKKDRELIEPDIYPDDERVIMQLKGNSDEETVEWRLKLLEDYKERERLVSKYRNKGSRETDRKKLKHLVRQIDKSLYKKGKKPTSIAVESEFMNNHTLYDSDNLVKEISEECLEYGNGKFVEWGVQFAKLLSGARKEFPKNSF